MKYFFSVLICFLIFLGCQDNEHELDEHDEHDEHELDEQDEHELDEHDEHDERPREVTLSQEALERGGIRIGNAHSGSINSELLIPAELQLNPNNVAHVSTMVEGQIFDVQAVVGDVVEMGEPLATIRSITLGRARADHRRADAMLDLARQNLAREQQLHSEGISSERSLLDAQFRVDEARAEREAAQAVLSVLNVGRSNGSDMTLQSPISGTIIQRHATHGESINPNDELFVIADLSNIWVIGQVYEQALSQVTQGMSATLSLQSDPVRRWEGIVDYISPIADELTRTVRIRVVLQNDDGILRPGLFGSLHLHSSTSSTSILLPESAIQTLDNHPVVFIPFETPNSFSPVSVSLGSTNQGLVEVLTGLSENDEVVLTGGFLLKSQLIRGELGGHSH